MKLIAPDYYEKFVCIADRCKHSCCIGWEIDIDEDTLRDYQSVEGAFGERLRAGIEIKDGCACFRLGEDERCPFLNGNGLCDIILNLGEDRLSQICTDHPRFCSFWSDRTEIGLGLCCEEAARLLLTRKEPIRLVVLQDDGKKETLPQKEKNTLWFRDKIFKILQDREDTIGGRASRIFWECSTDLRNASYENLLKLLRSMEILAPEWNKLLSEVEPRSYHKFLPTLRNKLGILYDGTFLSEFEIAFEQLLWYFCYRYAYDPERFWEQGVRFALFSFFVIKWLFGYLCSKNENAGMEELIELCRMYSCEIEYSEENLQRIMDVI